MNVLGNCLRVRLLCVPGIALAVFMLGAPLAHAQRDNTSFSLYIENDTFRGSDTSYSNGFRLSWDIRRFRPGMRIFTDYNLLKGADKVLKTVGLGKLRLTRLGLIPDSIANVECEASMERRPRQLGACTILNLGIAQTIYTPDSLASTLVQLDDQPYAGFLYATFGVTTFDSPSARHRKNWFSFTEVSNQLLLGVTGKPAHAEDTQSLAHWTFATGAKRPMGWSTQLRSAVQVGLISSIGARPKRLEWCRLGCDGSESERRVLDVTSQSEAVVSTHMVRFSQGATARLGAHFPDAIGALRIPVSAPLPGAKPRCFWKIVCERYWYYGFVDVQARYVPYNMFLAGGLADGGPDGWRNIRQISPRHYVLEHAYGVAVGNTRTTIRAQYAYRTPEYDVMGKAASRGQHGYGSLTLAIHPRPN